MRVGVVHNLAAGGAHRRLSEQVAHLDAEIVEVCLATAQPVSPHPMVIGYRALAPGVTPALRPPLRYADLGRLVRAWHQAGSALGRARPDVVLASPCRYLQAPTALLFTSAPSLYFCDEPRESRAALAATRNPRTQLLYAPLHAAESRLDRAATTRASALATNSSFTAGRIRDAYGFEAVVLPMGIPAGFTASSEPAAHILSVGTLIPDKGHELVIRAAALARTRRPVSLVAPRDDAAETRRLRAVASQLGVELRIAIGISDDDLVAAYRSSHATLYLAREEPFGLVSLEAQACGSAVIATDAGGLPETLVDGVTGWVVPRDPAAAAAKLDLLDDPELRGRMSAAAADYAGAFTWARAAAALGEILAEVCERGGGAVEVLMLTNAIAPDKLGGLERYVRELAAELVRLGVPTGVFAKQVNESDPLEEAGADGVSLHRYRPPSRSSLLFAPAYPITTAAATRAATRNAGGAVLHAHFPVPALQLALARRRYLYTFHAPVSSELLLERHDRYALARPLQPIAVEGLRRAERLVVRRAAAITVLSEYSRSELRLLDEAAAERSVLIPGGIDTGRFSPGDAERDGWSAGADPYLFTARRLTPRTGVLELLQAMPAVLRAHPRARLAIAGIGDSEARLRAEASALGLDESVRFAGRIGEDELVAAYRTADVVIMPTQALEGYGLTTAEALACGTPVIGTPVGATPELLRGIDPSLISDDASSEAIAGAVVGLLGDRALLERIRGGLRAGAAQALGWPAVAARYLEQYELLASR